MLAGGCKAVRRGLDCPWRRDKPSPSRRALERAAAGGESPVGEGGRLRHLTLSTAGHAESRGKPGGPPPKAEYPRRPIADQYREGKVKRTPARGVKQT